MNNNDLNDLNRMKTAEEKAMEYTDNEFAILPKSMAKEDMRHRAQKDFEAGYNEAMRWRDPKVEPPTNQDIVLVKTDNDCYATAYFHGKASVFICYGEDAYIEFGDIIGWKPIE